MKTHRWACRRARKRLLQKKARRCCFPRNRPAGCSKALSSITSAGCLWARGVRPNQKTARERRGDCQSSVECRVSSDGRVGLPRREGFVHSSLVTRHSSHLLEPGAWSLELLPACPAHDYRPPAGSTHVPD